MTGDLRARLAEAFGRRLGPFRWDLADAALEVFDDDAQAKLLDDMMERTRIRDLQFRGGVNMDIDSAREVTSAWVAAARAMLGEAPDYSETPVEFEVKVAEPPERYIYVLTVQRADKPTPHQMRQRAEAERDEAREALARVEHVLAKLRDLADGSGSNRANFPHDMAYAAKLLTTALAGDDDA